MVKCWRHFISKSRSANSHQPLMLAHIVCGTVPTRITLRLCERMENHADLIQSWTNSRLLSQTKSQSALCLEHLPTQHFLLSLGHISLLCRSDHDPMFDKQDRTTTSILSCDWSSRLICHTHNAQSTVFAIHTRIICFIYLISFSQHVVLKICRMHI